MLQLLVVREGAVLKKMKQQISKRFFAICASALCSVVLGVRFVSAAAPTNVTTGATTNITQDSVTLDGSAAGTGLRPITDRGFEYGTTASYGAAVSENLVAVPQFSLQWGRNPVGDGQFQNPYDVAIDSSGNTYVADRDNNRIQKFDSSGSFITKWGTQGSGDGQFTSLMGLGIDDSNAIYVTDGSRIQKFDANGNFLLEFGSAGSGNGQFENIHDVAVDSSTWNIYVSDTNNHRIQKFDQNGNFISTWGSFGTGDGQLQYPVGVVFRGNYVYVADWQNHRIQKFDSNGAFITKWGSAGGGNGQFSGPRGIVVDSSNNLYVADTYNNRIQKFDSSHTYVTQWGWDPAADGQFSTPRGIATDSSGNIYVADYYNSRIQKFDSSGNFITKWGSGGNGNGQFRFVTGIVTDALDNVYVVDLQNARIQKFDSSGNFITMWGSYGTANGQFESPDGIATDSANNVYVTDSVTHRVQKFDSSGNFILTFGSTGGFSYQFNEPRGIAIDSSDNLYIVDRGNNRVQKFDSSGNFITMWGDQGHADAQFYEPEGIAIDGSDNVYVADTGSSRVEKFDSNGTFITEWGSTGVGSDQYNGLKDLVFDAQDNAYVVDSYNQRIQKYIPGTNSGSFAKDISGLTCGTTYHYRAYATNADGTSYGDDATFTTSACPVAPTVTTGSASDINTDSATLAINISSNGGASLTSFGVDYGTTTDYGQTSSNNYDTSGDQSFTIYDLTCSTTYHYRAYANNSVGSSHGDDATFTTSPCPQPYDLRLRASLLNTDPVKAGDTVHYQVTLKNLGPGGTSAAAIYINIPQETTFNSASFTGLSENFEAACEDMGPIAAIAGEVNVDGYSGDILACYFGSDEDYVNSGGEVTISLNLTATSDFTVGLTVLRAITFTQDEDEVDSQTIFAGFGQYTPFFGIPVNNIVNLIYGQNDADGDGIYDNIEQSAPNNGDANNDGIPDSEQANVSSLVDPETGKYVVLVVDDQCEITDVTVRAESANEAQDKDNDYPNGLMDFTLNCGENGFTANISQYYYGTSKDGFTVRKYNPSTKAYSTIDSASISESTIAGQKVTTASYQVKDGGSLDLDSQEDGSIHDPAGLARKDWLAGTGQNLTLALSASFTLVTLGGSAYVLRRARRSSRLTYTTLR